MENKSYKPSFAKLGNDIIASPVGSLDYSFKSGMTYSVSYDSYNNRVVFKESEELILPKLLYVSDEDDKFIERVLNRHSKIDTGTTGIMLAGTKGSGKTVMAKEIAIRSNLPIVVLSNEIRSCFLKHVFDCLKNMDICIMFDEIDKLDKYWDTNTLLQLIDGVTNYGKKLLICTCNEMSKVNSYLQDRCSRIRYYRKYDVLNPEIIRYLTEVRLNDKEHIEDFITFINDNFNLPSFDNVASFIDEVNEYNYTDTLYSELIEDMSIETKNNSKFKYNTFEINDNSECLNC